LGPLGVSLIEPTSAILYPPIYDPVLSTGLATEVFDPTLYRLTQLIRTALGAISTTQATMSTYLSQIASNTLLASQALDGAIRHPLIGDSYFQVSATVDNTVAHPIPCFLEVPIDVNILGTIPVNVTNSEIGVNVHNTVPVDVTNSVDVNVGNASLDVTGVVSVTGTVNTNITNASISTVPSNTATTPLYIATPSASFLNVCNIGYKTSPTGTFRSQQLFSDVTTGAFYPVVASLTSGSLLPHYNNTGSTSFNDLTAYPHMRMEVRETLTPDNSNRVMGNIPFSATNIGGAVSDSYLSDGSIGQYGNAIRLNPIHNASTTDQYGFWTPTVPAP